MQYIKHARVVFDPLDIHSTGAKEFLNLVHSPSMVKSNPLAKIEFQLESDKTPSYICVTYVNNSRAFFLAHKRNTSQIFFDMGIHAGQLEYQNNLDADEMDVDEADEVDEMK